MLTLTNKHHLIQSETLWASSLRSRADYVKQISEFYFELSILLEILWIFVLICSLGSLKIMYFNDLFMSHDF